MTPTEFRSLMTQAIAIANGITINQVSARGEYRGRVLNDRDPWPSANHTSTSASGQIQMEISAVNRRAIFRLLGDHSATRADRLESEFLTSSIPFCRRGDIFYIPTE